MTNLNPDDLDVHPEFAVGILTLISQVSFHGGCSPEKVKTTFSVCPKCGGLIVVSKTPDGFLEGDLEIPAEGWSRVAA